MARRVQSTPVTIQDALIFISKRAEDNVKRLGLLEKTLEEVAGDDGGEKDFAALKVGVTETGERVDSLLNRVTNLEKAATQEKNRKEKNEKLVKTVLEQFSSLREELAKLEELVHKSNQIDLVVTEDNVSGEDVPGEDEEDD